MLQSYRPGATLCLQLCLDETAATRSDVESRNAPSDTDFWVHTTPAWGRGGEKREQPPREHGCGLWVTHRQNTENCSCRYSRDHRHSSWHLAPCSLAGRGGTCCWFHPHTLEKSQMALANSSSGDEYKKKYWNHQNSCRFLSCVIHRHPATMPWLLQ